MAAVVDRRRDDGGESADAAAPPSRDGGAFGRCALDDPRPTLGDRPTPLPRVERRGRRRRSRHGSRGDARERRQPRRRGDPGGAAAPRPGRGRAPRSGRCRAEYLGTGRRHHPERLVLPHRHRVGRAADRPRRLVAPYSRNGRERGRPDVGRAGRPPSRGGVRHHVVRVQRGRRHPDRQRAVARLPDPAAPRPGTPDGGRRHGAVPVDRRLHRVDTDRGPHGPRPLVDPRRRDERGAPPARARVPGADGGAGAVRLRLGDEVGRRPRGDPLRPGDRVLDRPRMVRARSGQTAVAHRRAPPRSGIERGRHRHRGGRLAAARRHLTRGGAGRRRPLGGRHPRHTDFG